MIALITSILVIHLLWLAFVIFGALWTRGRPIWTAAHILALVWGIVVEVGPWPCPLTLAEDYFQGRTGVHPAHASFLFNLIESVVYPDAPYWVVTTCGVAVCALNLGVYLWRFRTWARSALHQ